jgi:holliday junction DNA helicase RuvA
MTNEEIATHLRQRASFLAQQGDNLYRIRAFRQAAMTVLALPQEVESFIATRGQDALARLPGIGQSLAQTIHELSRMMPKLQTWSGISAANTVEALQPVTLGSASARTAECSA